MEEAYFSLLDLGVENLLVPRKWLDRGQGVWVLDAPGCRAPAHDAVERSVELGDEVRHALVQGQVVCSLEHGVDSARLRVVAQELYQPWVR